MSNVRGVDYRPALQLERRWCLSHRDLQVAHVGMRAAHLDTGSAIMYLEASMYLVRRQRASGSSIL